MRSGNWKPGTNGDCNTICLLPIVEADVGGGDAYRWPESGPSLGALQEYTAAFFARQVRLLPPAVVRRSEILFPSSPARKKGDSILIESVLQDSRAGVFECDKADGDLKRFGNQVHPHKRGPIPVTIGSGRVEMVWTGDSQHDIAYIPSRVAVVAGDAVCVADGRDPTASERPCAVRLQLSVEPILSELVHIRTRCGGGGKGAGWFDGAFCVVAVTMLDLYSVESDLFIAGLAAGGVKVAAFSFHRYHPRLKMVR